MEKTSQLAPESFEKISSQLEGLYTEISTLSKKNPDGPTNEFKIQHINILIEEANSLLGENYLPLKGFVTFDLEELPSNSDIVLVLRQYILCLDELKSNHIEMFCGCWYWKKDNKRISIRTSAPKKLEK